MHSADECFVEAPVWRPWAWILRVAWFVGGVQVHSHPNPVLMLLPIAEIAVVATAVFVCMLPTAAAVQQIPQNLPTSYPHRPLPSPYFFWGQSKTTIFNQFTSFIGNLETG